MIKRLIGPQEVGQELMEAFWIQVWALSREQTISQAKR